MSFWSDSSLGGFEPKRQFRWTVSFKNLGGDLVFMASSANKQSYSVKGTDHHILNHIFKFPSKVEWKDIKVSFVDAVQPDIGSKFYNALLNAGYIQPVDFSSVLTGITKVQSTSVIGDVEIRQLDGGIVGGAELDPANIPGVPQAPNVVGKWTLKNAWLTEVDFGGELKYESEGLVTIATTIKYDYATYDPAILPYGVG